MVNVCVAVFVNLSFSSFVEWGAAQEWTCHTRAENNWVDSPRFSTGLVLNHGESRIASLRWKLGSIYNIFNIIKIFLMKPR